MVNRKMSLGETIQRKGDLGNIAFREGECCGRVCRRKKRWETRRILVLAEYRRMFRRRYWDTP